MRLVSIPLVFVLAAVSVVAAGPGSASAQEVRTNPSTGAFTETGLDVAPAGASARERALAYVKDRAGLWLTNRAMAFEVGREEVSLLGTVVHVALKVDGIPVENGLIRVFENASGRVTKVVSDLPAAVEVTGSFVLDQAEARNAAAELVTVSEKRVKNSIQKTVRRIYYLSGRRLVAAWACSFLAPDLVSSFVVVLNAETGELLKTTPGSHSWTVYPNVA